MRAKDAHSQALATANSEYNFTFVCDSAGKCIDIHLRMIRRRVFGQNLRAKINGIRSIIKITKQEFGQRLNILHSELKELLKQMKESLEKEIEAWKEKKSERDQLLPLLAIFRWWFADFEIGKQQPA